MPFQNEYHSMTAAEMWAKYIEQNEEWTRNSTEDSNG